MTDDEKQRILAESRAILDGSWTPDRFPTRAEPERSPPIEKSRVQEPGKRTGGLCRRDARKRRRLE